MAKTAHLDLPLVMPSQAQKHVTVNESLARLDAAVQLRVLSAALQEPPEGPSDGASYLVPQDATGAWQGKSGRIAVWSNGGWIFLGPKAGWRAWDESIAGYQLFDGTDWHVNAIAASPGGASMGWKIVEFDHEIAPGGENLTSVPIPAQTQVLGVTGRVSVALQGAGLSGWRVGVDGSDNRYASGIGKELDSVLVGLSGTAVTYYAPTPLLLTAEGGTFASGRIRLALHLLEINPPRSA